MFGNPSHRQSKAETPSIGENHSRTPRFEESSNTFGLANLEEQGKQKKYGKLLSTKTLTKHGPLFLCFVHEKIEDVIYLASLSHPSELPIGSLRVDAEAKAEVYQVLPFKEVGSQKNRRDVEQPDLIPNLEFMPHMD